MSVTNYPDSHLILRAIRNARPKTLGECERWVAVGDTFALGSTYAIELCRLYDVDPHEKIGGVRCLTCEERES